MVINTFHTGAIVHVKKRNGEKIHEHLKYAAVKM